jgi:hypothetical protein
MDLRSKLDAPCHGGDRIEIEAMTGLDPSTERSLGLYPLGSPRAGYAQAMANRMGQRHSRNPSPRVKIRWLLRLRLPLLLGPFGL